MDHRKSSSESCHDGIKPFVCTSAAFQKLMIGPEAESYDDIRSCNDCCWLCFPVTIAFDLATVIPFGAFYGTKKLVRMYNYHQKQKESKPKNTVVTTQPSK